MYASSMRTFVTIVSICVFSSCSITKYFAHGLELHWLKQYGEVNADLSQKDFEIKTLVGRSISKRAADNVNEIGGVNENGETVQSPTVTSNEIQYSEPVMDDQVSNRHWEVSVKPVIDDGSKANTTTNDTTDSKTEMDNLSNATENADKDGGVADVTESVAYNSSNTNNTPAIKNDVGSSTNTSEIADANTLSTSVSNNIGDTTDHNFNYTNSVENATDFTMHLSANTEAQDSATTRENGSIVTESTFILNSTNGQIHKTGIVNVTEPPSNDNTSVTDSAIDEDGSSNPVFATTLKTTSVNQTEALSKSTTNFDNVVEANDSFTTTTRAIENPIVTNTFNTGTTTAPVSVEDINNKTDDTTHANTYPNTTVNSVDDTENITDNETHIHSAHNSTEQPSTTEITAVDINGTSANQSDATNGTVSGDTSSNQSALANDTVSGDSSANQSALANDTVSGDSSANQSGLANDTVSAYGDGQVDAALNDTAIDEPTPEPEPTGDDTNVTSSDIPATNGTAVTTPTQTLPAANDSLVDGSGDVTDVTSPENATAATVAMQTETTGKPTVSPKSQTTTERQHSITTVAPTKPKDKILTSEWQPYSSETTMPPTSKTGPIPSPEDKTSSTSRSAAITTKLTTTSKVTSSSHTSAPTPEPSKSSPQSSKFTTILPKTNDATPTMESPKDSGKSKPEPTTDPISEPSEITTSSPEPEVESEPESEKEEPKDEPELNFDAFAEPGPDWEIAKEEWKEAWEFHVYFFGICFVILGLYCVAMVVRLWSMEHLLSRHYFLTLHLLVIFVCILRATYLLVDAYNSLGSFPIVVDYFLYNTAFPCISSLFSILFHALLLATRVRVISPKIQKLGVLIFIISLHFGLSITTDLVVGLLSTAAVLIFICQAVFIIWGLFMFIGYLIVFRKLYKGAINRQKNMKHHSPDRKHATSTNSDKSKHKYTFGLAVKITFMSAFFGVAIVGFELYGMFGVYGVLRPDVKPQPWPWWTYHFIVRTLELLMCSSVAYVASQPLKYTVRKDASILYQYLLPCNLCCCNDKFDNSYDSSTISLENVSETDHLGWLKKMRNKKAHAPYPPHAAEKYSDPDATLLVRKIKQNKPSMLVVEDGFVRIRRDDEILPSNQYELDSNSRSSQSSGLNASGPVNEQINAQNTVVNWNYSGDPARTRFRENMPLSFSLDNYRLPSIGCIGDGNRESVLITESTDDTDIDIAVTDSEHDHSDDERDHELADGAQSTTSDKSGDIFRPLSMIDLAASMESELDRAFHTSCVTDEQVPKCDRASSEHVYRPSGENNTSVIDSDNSDSDQSKTSSARLIRSPIRRCKSEEPHSTKCKLFEKNKYYSLSSVESAGKCDQPFEWDSRLKLKRK